MAEPVYNDDFSFSYKRRKSTRVYDYDNFLTQLKKALMVSEITQGEISRKLGVGRNTVSMWMSGKNKIPMDKAFKIMEMMDFPASYYFDDASLSNDTAFISDWDEKMEKVRESMSYIKYTFSIYCTHKKKDDPNADKIQVHLNEIWKIFDKNACNIRGIYKGYEYQPWYTTYLSKSKNERIKMKKRALPSVEKKSQLKSNLESLNDSKEC